VSTPKLRFKGFSGEWEEKDFNKVFMNISNNTLSRAELNYNFGQAKNIHYGDVLIKFGELLDIEKEEVPFISNNDFVTKFKSSRLQNGDVIIADAAEDEMVGKCTEIVNIKDEVVFSGLHTIAVRPIQTFASKYLGYYMNSLLYHNQLLRLLQGTKVLSISKSAIKNTEIYSPKDFLEQTKIGNYFQNLDKLIEQKEKKYQKLRQFKKAMLDKMYPKNGATTPELRFKGFSGEWEERKLGEVTDLLTGNPFASKKFVKKGVFLVRGMNVKRGYLDMSKDISEYWVSSNGLEIYLLKEDDILIQMDGALIGKSYAKVQSKNLPALLVQRVTRIRNEKINSEFIYQYIQRDFLSYIATIKTETAVPHLSLNDIRNFQIAITPSINEQTKIGNYFQQLDKLINLHQSELTKLKNIKKASLEKMFV